MFTKFDIYLRLTLYSGRTLYNGVKSVDCLLFQFILISNSTFLMAMNKSQLRLLQTNLVSTYYCCIVLKVRPKIPPFLLYKSIRYTHFPHRARSK